MNEQTPLDLMEHDLRNALSVILGNAQILALSLGRADMEEERCMAEEVVDAVSAMSAMVTTRIASLKDREG